MEEENIQTENRSVNNCTFVRIRGFPRQKMIQLVAAAITQVNAVELPQQ